MSETRAQTPQKVVVSRAASLAEVRPQIGQPERESSSRGFE